MDPTPSADPTADGATSAPPTRADRQRETREALVMAALMAFTRDGYNGASLEGIAHEAGFSKGAVYSNFDGKAELFLAVMDHNLAALRGADWDPFAPQPTAAATGDASCADEDDPVELVRGFGLATLEFIAIAARDERVMAELRARFQVLLDAYARIAAESRAEGEDLPVDDVARLMVALDQGMSVLALSGAIAIEDGLSGLLRTGLLRLLDPARAAAEPSPASVRVASAHPDVQRVRQLIAETD